MTVPLPLPALAVRAPEAARMLGVSPRWLANQTATGRLPSAKIAGIRLYRVEDLDEFLRQQQTDRKH